MALHALLVFVFAVGLLIIPFFSYFLLRLPSGERRKNKEDTASNRSNLPPGPKRLPIIGNLHQVIGGVLHRSLFQLSQKHGPLMYLELGNRPTIVASSTELAKEFLHAHDLDCCTRPVLISRTKLSYNRSDIVFAPYGDMWRQLRKIGVLELFSIKKSQTSQYIRQEEVERMVEWIASQAEKGVVIDLSEEMLALANNITSRTVFGRRCIDRETGEGCRLPEMIKETQALIGRFCFADFVPALGWIDALTGMRARLQKNYEDFEELYRQVIAEHSDPARQNVEHLEDTLDALLRIQREEPHLTDDHIKGLVADVIFGGTDTSSAIVEWTMTELIKHPEILKKVQAEVRGAIGNKGKVEDSDLPKLEYMKCVLKESMRFHPPTPLLPRETMRACKIKGFDIPANTMVLINSLAISREEGVWEDAEEFKPERFVSSPVDVKGHDFQLLPFGAGRRVCPGMHAGMAVVELAFANLLYWLDWELPEGVEEEDIDMGEAPGLAVHRKIGLQLVARKHNYV